MVANFESTGYHRLWSHRSYNASLPLRIFLSLAGASAVQGSTIWWARAHRAHHRYTDTARDPYAVYRGLFHAHIGWTLLKPAQPHGRVDVGDLRRDAVVAWQHRWYLALAPALGYALPAVLPGALWGDWRGGLFFAAMTRLTAVHHVSACVRGRRLGANAPAHSARSASTPSRTGSATRRTTTGTPRATTCSPRY
jgi:stearoyl-CoA desaturase (delta-9 desaturase)